VSCVALQLAPGPGARALANKDPLTCSRYAAPGGSDRGPGSATRPFATPQRLIGTLRAGEVGCLRGGVYRGDIAVSNGGASGRPLTLTSYPGERARLVGRLYIRSGAHDLRFARISLDGRNALALPSPTVYGRNVSFYGDNVTNGHSTICFDLGAGGGIVARDIRIERSAIHDCGRLPADNHEHGIYVENTRDVRIAWNLIYGNADRGIQLYPDAQRTSIVHNVIYGNGEGILFSGSSGTASSGALVAHNVISDSNVRSNIESWYPSGNPRGTHNTVTDNCIGASSDTPLNQSGGGFDASRNLLVEPAFVNAPAHDFRLSAGSPCRNVAGDVPSAVASAL
jgi:hypothetical protein